METFSLLLSLACVLVSISLTMLFTLRSGKDHENNLKLPPGGFGWPVIGETIQLLFEKPEKFVEKRMKMYSPDIFKTKIFGEKIAVICGPGGHKFLFTNEVKIFTLYLPLPIQKLFKVEDAMAPSANSHKPQADLPLQKEAKLVRQAGFLKPEALVGYLGEMDSITQQLLQSHLQGKDEVKAYPLAKTLTLVLACRFFLGTDKPERIARLGKQFDDVKSGMHSLLLDFPGTAFYRAKKAARAIGKELMTVINEKKAAVASGNPKKDIMSHMMAASDAEGKHMPEEEIAHMIMGLLIAGYSTLASTIAFFMKVVGERPDIYDKIRKEQMEIAASKKPGEPLEWEDMQKMKYSWNVICETMRLIPPIRGTFREALTDFTYAGYTVPKGWKVYWTGSTTYKNPAYFREPDKFDPSRYEKGEIQPYTYVPFGGGPRLCPGKEYTRLAILAFIHNVVKVYRWEVLFPDEKVLGDMMPYPEKGVPIRLYNH